MEMETIIIPCCKCNKDSEVDIFKGEKVDSHTCESCDFKSSVKEFLAIVFFISGIVGLIAQFYKQIGVFIVGGIRLVDSFFSILPVGLQVGMGTFLLIVVITLLFSITHRDLF